MVEHLHFTVRNIPTHQSSNDVSLSVRVDEIYPVVVLGEMAAE